MASDVDICNLALARLGDSATVTALNPPSGSAQAGHCATFYPMVRTFMLGAHNWAWILRRQSLTMLQQVPPFGWLYYFAEPAGSQNILSLHVGGAPDDSNPITFDRETLSDGTAVILCNINNPVAKYTVDVTDTTKFDPLFIETFSFMLASALAGPVIKGDAGRAASADLFRLGMMALMRAKSADAMQRKVRPTHIPMWLQVRAGSIEPPGATNDFNPPIG